MMKAEIMTKSYKLSLDAFKIVGARNNGITYNKGILQFRAN
jgi:hypothetical protein